MTTLSLVLGDQLFPDRSFDEVVFMAEHPELTEHYRYHSHKLVLFLSAMRSYARTITEPLVYYRLDEVPEGASYTDLLARTVEEHDITRIRMFEIEDRIFEERIRAFCEDNALELVFEEAPFLTSREEFASYRASHKRLFQHEFYAWQRRRLDILMDGSVPRFGKWSFDAENRKKLPKGIGVPPITRFDRTTDEEDVITLISERYPEHPGDPNEFWLPTTHERALVWFDDFLKERFASFGPYEDALSSEHRIVFHSVLSPLLNTGLLTPGEVVRKALSYAEDVPYPSLEGFVRQIIGWREFIRGVYRSEPGLESSNALGNDRLLADAWYEGSTGILPLDDAIRRAVRWGYLHHIERLMVVGNLMNLAGVHPDEGYRWFMELFVDSAGWVMVPNVYGMAFFADGSFTTKPYVAGSNYLRKMSDYPKGSWCDTVDGLYWRFVDRHRGLFAKNPRLSMMLGALERMDDDRKRALFVAAERFIEQMTSHMP
ncbi:MAG: cryptochrome/photolyase family protein [Candidatus Woesearchaeota archaeon]